MTSTKAGIVAGVGPGLGSALARTFAQAGYCVGLISRRLESSAPVAREIKAAGGKALVALADVTNREAVFRAVEKVREEFGPITLLAYNASGEFLKLDPELFRQSFELSVMGAVHTIQAVFPDMLAAGHGAISLTGATASVKGGARYAPFAAAKGALRMMGQSLARELHPKGIHVLSVIVDGQINTFRTRQMYPGREAETMMDPDAIARTILDILSQPRNAWTHEIDIRPYVERF